MAETPIIMCQRGVALCVFVVWISQESYRDKNNQNGVSEKNSLYNARVTVALRLSMDRSSEKKRLLLFLPSSTKLGVVISMRLDQKVRPL
jgi:hypothetical protein